MPHAYETDGAAIYRKSFATIRAEADLARFTAAAGIGCSCDASTRTRSVAISCTARHGPQRGAARR